MFLWMPDSANNTNLLHPDNPDIPYQRLHQTMDSFEFDGKVLVTSGSNWSILEVDLKNILS